MRFMLSETVWLRRVFWGAALLVLLLSLLPGTERLPSTGWDKANHLLAFALLSLLACAGWPRRLAWMLPALLAYGALIELLQALTPYRFAEWGDLLADGLGIALGWAFAQWMTRHTAAARA